MLQLLSSGANFPTGMAAIVRYMNVETTTTIVSVG